MRKTLALFLGLLAGCTPQSDQKDNDAQPTVKSQKTLKLTANKPKPREEQPWTHEARLGVSATVEAVMRDGTTRRFKLVPVSPASGQKLSADTVEVVWTCMASDKDLNEMTPDWKPSFGPDRKGCIIWDASLFFTK